MVKLGCDIEAQNCASLFSPASGLIKLPYASGSCVRDARLAGNVGRCGFPGAQCTTDSSGNDNCAFGGDSTKPNYKPLCQKGLCGGGLGAICTNGDFDCNWGYYCNATAGQAGVCGGQGSFVSDQGDGGDFAVDYCLSGKATLTASGFWYCLGGQFLGVIPSTTSTPLSTNTATSSGTQAPPTLPTGSPQDTLTNTGTNTKSSPPSTNTDGSASDNTTGGSVQSKGKSDKTPIIAGVCAAVGVVLIALLAFLAWRRYTKNKKAKRAVNGAISYPVPQHPTGVSGISDQQPPSFASGASPASIPQAQLAPVRSFGYLPEIQGEATRNNTGSTYPSNLHPVAPNSPHANYNMSLGSNPSLAPLSANHPSPGQSYSQAQDPFLNPMVENPAYTGGSGPSQYSSSGNMDATERHLLAVREDAERQLRAYDQRGR